MYILYIRSDRYTLTEQDGINLSVVTIWLQRKSDGKFQFITLVPGD